MRVPGSRFGSGFWVRFKVPAAALGEGATGERMLQPPLLAASGASLSSPVGTARSAGCVIASPSGSAQRVGRSAHVLVCRNPQRSTRCCRVALRRRPRHRAGARHRWFLQDFAGRRASGADGAGPDSGEPRHLDQRARPRHEDPGLDVPRSRRAAGVVARWSTHRLPLGHQRRADAEGLERRRRRTGADAAVTAALLRADRPVRRRFPRRQCVGRRRVGRPD